MTQKEIIKSGQSQTSHKSVVQTTAFKQTEVGLIPSDWDIEILETLSTRIGDGIHSTPVYSTDGEYYFVNGNNLLNGKIFITEDTKRVSKEQYLLNKREINHSTVLLSINGTIGNVAFYNDEKIVLGKSAAYINLNEKIDKNLLYQLIQTEFIKRYFDNELTGSTIKNLGLGSIRNTPIPLPPTKAEQTAIATALSDADALISSLEKLIAKKRMIKQGAMQQLLQPKEGWLNKSLGEIGEITGAGVDKLIVEGETPVRLVNYMDVFNRDFIYSKELNHWVTAPSHKANKCSVKQGDIFFTPSSEMRYDIAVSAVAMEDIPDAVYSYHLVRLRLFEDWDLNFRPYIFKTKYFLGQAEQICEGSGKRYVITLPKFRSMKIFYPPTKEEQNRIATILSDMDAEIAALETKLEKYRKVKLGMMQNLLTGKIRLNH